MNEIFEEILVVKFLKNVKLYLKLSMYFVVCMSLFLGNNHEQKNVISFKNLSDKKYKLPKYSTVNVAIFSILYFD